jgi:Uma2 family endonuclease
MASDPKLHLTLEQYLELEANSHDGSRHEYQDGELFPVEAATPNHALISANLAAALHNKLRRGPCRVYGSSLIIKAGRRYAYPDLAVVCGAVEMMPQRDDVILNPVLLAEVLSPATGDFDRGTKFQLYRAIPSFREYLIVHQDELLVEQHIRQPNADWLMRQHRDPPGSFALHSVVPAIELALADIYEDVIWPAPG